jgi:hypothetical protein
MTFNETEVNRDRGGKFAEKTGSAAEVSLGAEPAPKYTVKGIRRSTPEELTAGPGLVAVNPLPDDDALLVGSEAWDIRAQGVEPGPTRGTARQALATSERRPGWEVEEEYAAEREARAKNATGNQAELLLTQARQARGRAEELRARAELRERTIVPLKNPFAEGDKLTIPAGTTIIETDSYGGYKGKTVASRKRNAAAITATQGYYLHVPHRHVYGGTAADHAANMRILNDFQMARPYVQWFGPNHVNRVYLTEEFLEANGKNVEYDEEMFDKYAEDIGSGHFGVEGVTKS